MRKRIIIRIFIISLLFIFIYFAIDYRYKDGIPFVNEQKIANTKNDETEIDINDYIHAPISDKRYFYYLSFYSYEYDYLFYSSSVDIRELLRTYFHSDKNIYSGALPLAKKDLVTSQIKEIIDKDIFNINEFSGYISNIEINDDYSEYVVYINNNDDSIVNFSRQVLPELYKYSSIYLKLANNRNKYTSVILRDNITNEFIRTFNSREDTETGSVLN